MLTETTRLRVNRIACSGHGLCAELLPELVTLDEWGYPVLAGDGTVPLWLAREARRAVTDCPALALTLLSLPAAGTGQARLSGLRANTEEAQMPGRASTGTLGT
ncbi:MAG TPA: ferredoxin [Streptosporangiaceae bacterium]|nr:ferredoxin [Streptosporangiaceae bacterium]